VYRGAARCAGKPAEASYEHLQHDLGFPVQLALEGQLGVG
jgi:hypothetical protein